MSYSTIRDCFELLYFISGIVMAGTVIIGYKQLSILKTELSIVKQDYNTKLKRQSYEKSIEIIKSFADTFVPELVVVISNLTSLNVAPYSGQTNYNFELDRLIKNNPEELSKISFKINNGTVHIINKIEALSATFITGVADEEIAFYPCARMYCSVIDTWMFDSICYIRLEGKEKFTYTKQLYKIWNERIKEYDLNKSKEEIDIQLSTISYDKPKVIGL